MRNLKDCINLNVFFLEKTIFPEAVGPLRVKVVEKNGKLIKNSIEKSHPFKVKK